MKFKLTTILQASILALLTVAGAYASSHTPATCAAQTTKVQCEL
ncbi:hypothetical protein P775_27275 [Puniceibacterium antarcticum]|uniref:Uncharacterized protein n=1 Tax=Puniceibacterium antarcticum TaxID=1206336 RepID=A0A2G8QWJ9_9RHOB|nr:hypothetical protein [Puniceibacterium antarcticum]PIL13667.1 hypothetical protein P775_27275 [Puniceibacterium antarcticum]